MKTFARLIFSSNSSNQLNEVNMPKLDSLNERRNQLRIEKIQKLRDSVESSDCLGQVSLVKESEPEKRTSVAAALER